MAQDVQGLVTVLEDVLSKLKIILGEVSIQKQEDSKTEINLKEFFDAVKVPALFPRGLNQSQVGGIEAKLKAFREAGFPVSWAAYALATSFHETAKRMQPVREGLSASDSWRKRNLRYYPWYGRGDVQLTWEDNYKRMDTKLGLGGQLIRNLDLALDPAISAKIMVVGMKEGLFSKDRAGKPQSLGRYLPSDNTQASKEQFTEARRIINLMDKAGLIAGYAVAFQNALSKAGYGEVT